MNIQIPARARAYVLCTAVIALGVVSGCATEPTMQTGEDAEVTYDGLVRVDNAAFSNVWIRPERDLSSYNAIIPVAAGIQYREVRSTSNVRRSSGTTEFPIPESTRQELEAMATEVFSEELANSQHFTITDKPGPDVLIIEGGLIDVVSRVPPERTGRGNTWVANFGEATLIMELRDSVTNETLVRAAERRSASPTSGGRVANSVTARSEVRRVLRRWATTLRQGLDAVHEM